MVLQKGMNGGTSKGVPGNRTDPSVRMWMAHSKARGVSSAGHGHMQCTQCMTVKAHISDSEVVSSC